jgi:uncharacterized membrane protein
MSDKTKKVITDLLYFLITIVALSSAGVWLPFLLDKFDKGVVSTNTMHEYPGNLLTYGLGIFIIAIIDRIIHLFKRTNRYTNNVLEFLLLIIIIGACTAVVGLSIGKLKFNKLADSIFYAKATVIIAWIGWIYVKFRSPEYANFSAIGGPMS